MSAMDYFKRIGRGVKALGGEGSSQGDGLMKIAGGIRKEVGGLFKKKSKAGSEKTMDRSGKNDL